MRSNAKRFWMITQRRQWMTSQMIEWEVDLGFPWASSFQWIIDIFNWAPLWDLFLYYFPSLQQHFWGTLWQNSIFFSFFLLEIHSQLARVPSVLQSWAILFFKRWAILFSLMITKLWRWRYKAFSSFVKYKTRRVNWLHSPKRKSRFVILRIHVLRRIILVCTCAKRKCILLYKCFGMTRIWTLDLEHWIGTSNWLTC